MRTISDPIEPPSSTLHAICNALNRATATISKDKGLSQESKDALSYIEGLTRAIRARIGMVQGMYDEALILWDMRDNALYPRELTEDEK